ncbi:autotransporter outer membrane beta-barrel domain-containing protein [Pseudomonas sediminis]|uniref:Autotransporter domain-containing protein n=1 Tax=Pseudomonas sediminis TaxID=1691904 RepID=A0ABX6SCW5_9PSED|nr:autotransporter domain-containing protein [Pseudomonas sediminis]QNG98999.1 autotransporter domain-containing protein [Pseudomonas sediminis]
MERSYKAVFNRPFAGQTVLERSSGRNKARESYRSFASALLATGFSIATGTAAANIVIDNGALQSVPSGTQFDAAGYLIVGGNTIGQLHIASGGEATNTDAYIGLNNGSQGEVVVSGADATWTTDGDLYIGWDGNAFVMVDDGARIVAGGVTILAVNPTAYSQLTLSGTSGSRGVFSTPYIFKGIGTGELYWDGGILQARSDEPEFFPNFAFLDINIAGNGAFFDTNGYNVGVQTPGILIGTGGFTKLGAGTLTIAGNNSWNGDTTVSAGTLALGSYTQSGSQTLTIGVADSANYGRLNVSGVANFNNSNLAVDVIGSPVLANNQSLTGVVTAGTLNATSFIVTDNSALFDFNATINSNSVDLNVIASGNGSSGTTVYGSALNNRLYPALGAASVLDTQVQGTPTGDMANVVTALGRLPDERSVARAAAQTLPLNAGAQATLGALNTINSIFASRFAPGTTGMSSGDLALNKNVWIRPFGSRADQDDTDDNASGYSADTWGLAAGVEGDIGETQIGIAYAYANTRLDGNTRLSGAGTSAQIDSHVIALYGSRPLNDMVLGFQVDAGWNDNDSDRPLDFGGLNRSASASYDSWSLHVGSNLSKAFVLNQANTFIPAIRADYTRLRSQSYTERGAGALSLDVEANTVEVLTLGIDGRIVHALSPNAQLEAIVGVSYDAINDDGNLAATYTGAPGQSFVATGIDHGPWLAKAGVGYTYRLENGTDISIRYEANGRDDYLNQSASVKAVWNF